MESIIASKVDADGGGTLKPPDEINSSKPLQTVGSNPTIETILKYIVSR